MSERLKFLRGVNAKRKSVEWVNNSNCIGTARYLVGEHSVDELTYKGDWSGKDHSSLVMSLDEISFPIAGCLAAWISEKKVYHLGVVVNSSPVLIAQRNGVGGIFSGSVSFSDVNKSYYKSGCNICYYLPDKLKKAIAKDVEVFS